MKGAIQEGVGAIRPAGFRQRDACLAGPMAAPPRENQEFAANSSVFVSRRAAVNDAGLSRGHAAGLFAP